MGVGLWLRIPLPLGLASLFIWQLIAKTLNNMFRVSFYLFKNHVNGSHAVGICWILVSFVNITILFIGLKIIEFFKQTETKSIKRMSFILIRCSRIYKIYFFFFYTFIDMV